VIKIPIKRRTVKRMSVPFVTWFTINVMRAPVTDVFCLLGIHTWHWGIEFVVLDVGLAFYWHSDYDGGGGV